MAASETGDAILTGRFAFRSPALWFPRAHLHPDRLELTGWRWSGRYRRSLPLNQILQVDAVSAEELLLWLAGGETVRLKISQAPRWKAAIERRQVNR